MPKKAKEKLGPEEVLLFCLQRPLRKQLLRLFVKEKGDLSPKELTIPTNVGSRSAIEWVMERYQIRTDKQSGLTNDPNDWSREVGDPRYVVDLLARMVTVSLRMMQIVDDLPPLVMREGQAETPAS